LPTRDRGISKIRTIAVLPSSVLGRPQARWSHQHPSIQPWDLPVDDHRSHSHPYFDPLQFRAPLSNLHLQARVLPTSLKRVHPLRVTLVIGVVHLRRTHRGHTNMIRAV
jgi:hypothetical protein